MTASFIWEVIIKSTMRYWFILHIAVSRLSFFAGYVRQKLVESEISDSGCPFSRKFPTISDYPICLKNDFNSNIKVLHVWHG